MKDQEYYENMRHNSRVGGAIYLFTAITLVLVITTLLSFFIFCYTYQIDKLYITEILFLSSVIFGLFGYGYVKSMRV